MDVIPYTKARANLAKTMEQVCDDHTPITITRRNKPPVVMVSLEDYHAMDETAYLLRGTKNAELLLESVTELKSGRGLKKELLE
ncbi:MAG: type II toxin-antitoxin system prevent-host-death family antitoxin [SAR324 cluster bacterium]|nr:type II toxin-antitoxin system prevent-host-death family antitoxin [SAR324 cluster bacterium]